MSNDDDLQPQADAFDTGGDVPEVPGGEPIGEAPAEYQPEPSRDELRQRLMGQFEQWVDRMLAGEPLPQGLPEELQEQARQVASGEIAFPQQGCDLYTLFSALTALSGEVGLQGRAFKQVADALAPLSNLPQRIRQIEAAQQESADRLSDLLAKVQEEDEPSAMPSSKEALGVIFDLYDRLERGLKTLDAGTESLRSRTAGGWLARLSGASDRIQEAITATEGMREAQRLLVSRLEAAMHQWGIERIGEAGELFDPQVMTAVEVQASEEPDGTILEVYRSGYMLHGQVLATAQVKVAKGT